MKTLRACTALLILAWVLVSCTAFAAAPTATPIPTDTQLPTATASPSATPTQYVTPTATGTLMTPTDGVPVFDMPAGTPASEWWGVHIMPGAIAGEGDSSQYRFVIKASVAEVQAYYEREFKRQGWQMEATGQGETSATLTVFSKAGAVVSMAVIPQPDGLVSVLLVL